MNISFLCVFLAFLLNYITKLPVTIAMAKKPGGYDNRHPRDQQATLTGWGKRALSSHLNSFEIFPAFAAAVIIANIAHVNSKSLAILSIIFLALRTVYIILYLLNWCTLRTVIWFLSLLCIITIFCLGI